MAGRRIFNEYDAQRCLAAIRRTGAPLGAWARAHGIDGRSLNLWRANLARRGQRRARPTPAQVVELVPVASRSAVARAPFIIRIAGAELEVGADFDDEAVRRLIGLLKSC
jgi:transposase-like protein